MVGSAIALDLAADDGFDVTVADIRADTLPWLEAHPRLTAVTADLAVARNVTECVSGYDIVIGALSSHLGYATLPAVIDAGVNYVDISFMPENPLDFHERATAKGVTAVVDCGVAPGITNMMAGYATTQLDPFEQLEIYVGGLPSDRRWPFQYKAAFAPADAIEEYTRPARMVEHGKVVTRPALSGVEQFDFPGVGTLEGFNTDGLRTLLHSLDVPTMIEKTLRYPGHAELMRVFREMGFFNQAPIEVEGQRVSPLAVTSALLFEDWRYGEQEEDITVSRFIARGRDKSSGETTRLQWDLLDRRDPDTGIRSMSRTTGYPASIVARMVAAGKFTEAGVHPPEDLGKVPGVLEHVLEALRARGVNYTEA